MAEPLLQIRGLDVRFTTPTGEVHAVRGVDLDVTAGETVALVGESGSGKSALARALLRLNQPPFTAPRTYIAGEAIWRGGHAPLNLVGAGDAALRAVRARDVALVFQDALSGLNPVLRVGDQIAEAVEAADPALSAGAVASRVSDFIARIGLPEPAQAARRYPHQLSGGQRQRVMIAIAAARNPKLLIADEPTTALDALVGDRLIDLLRDIQRERGMAMLFITHDLPLVRRLADRVAVMRAGALVETATTPRLFARPAHAYTRALLAADPTAVSAAPTVAATPEAARLQGVSVRFGGGFPRSGPELLALDDVSLSLRRGEKLGVVGESGSGKTTLARLLNGLQRPTSGTVTVFGADPARLRGAAAGARRRRVQTVFQDSAAAFDPRMTIGASVREGLDVHRIGAPAERDARVAAALRRVALDPALAARRPHELSGGQRQRAAIARALVVEPALLVADEPVSALDAATRATVVALLDALHAELGLTLVMVSHDLDVVRRICDRTAVMRGGRLIELGPTGRILDDPQEPYTKALVARVTRGAAPPGGGPQSEGAAADRADDASRLSSDHRATDDQDRDEPLQADASPTPRR